MSKKTGKRERGKAGGGESFFTVKASEWRKMPEITKRALAEMARLLLKHVKGGQR